MWVLHASKEMVGSHQGMWLFLFIDELCFLFFPLPFLLLIHGSVAYTGC